MTVKQWCLATKITYFHNLNLYGMLYYNVYTDLVSNSPNYQLPLTLAVRFVTANWNFSLVLEPAIWPALATLLKAPFSQLVPADTYLQVGWKYRTIEGISNEKLERLRWSASAWWFLLPAHLGVVTRCKQPKFTNLHLLLIWTTEPLYSLHFTIFVKVWSNIFSS